MMRMWSRKRRGGGWRRPRGAVRGSQRTTTTPWWAAWPWRSQPRQGTESAVSWYYHSHDIFLSFQLFRSLCLAYLMYLWVSYTYACIQKMRACVCIYSTCLYPCTSSGWFYMRITYFMEVDILLEWISPSPRSPFPLLIFSPMMYITEGHFADIGFQRDRSPVPSKENKVLERHRFGMKPRRAILRRCSSFNLIAWIPITIFFSSN